MKIKSRLILLAILITPTLCAVSCTGSSNVTDGSDGGDNDDGIIVEETDEYAYLISVSEAVGGCVENDDCSTTTLRNEPTSTEECMCRSISLYGGIPVNKITADNRLKAYQEYCSSGTDPDCGESEPSVYPRYCVSGYELLCRNQRCQFKVKLECD